MKQYHKIQTIFKRDPDTKFKTLLYGNYSLPEFEYLANNEWIFTEKVDGTNIRIMYDDSYKHVSFGGKTDNAQIPTFLLNVLKDTFTPEKFKDFDCPVCLYGEGYGEKIQKGGGNYRKDQSFVLFDVRIGEFWLKRKDIEEIAEQMQIDIVPVIGYGTLERAIKMTKDGFNSTWGDFASEGLVCKPVVDLRTRNGQRIITKIKHKDFAQEEK